MTTSASEPGVSTASDPPIIGVRQVAFAAALVACLLIAATVYAAWWARLPGPDAISAQAAALTAAHSSASPDTHSSKPLR